MNMPVVAVLWPDEANYSRFEEVCDKPLKARTVQEYRTSIRNNLEQLSKRGVIIKRVKFNPDELVQWAANDGRAVDSEARALFAAMMAHREETKRR